jgi:hypothetical protein
MPCLRHPASIPVAISLHVLTQPYQTGPVKRVQSNGSSRNIRISAGSRGASCESSDTRRTRASGRSGRRKRNCRKGNSPIFRDHTNVALLHGLSSTRDRPLSLPKACGEVAERQRISISVNAGGLLTLLYYHVELPKSLSDVPGEVRSLRDEEDITCLEDLRSRLVGHCYRS